MLGGVAVAQPAAAPAEQPVSASPCAPCVTLIIEPGQALVLRAPLNGLSIAVRVPSGAEQTASSSLAAVRGLGGVPGILVTGVPAGSLDPGIMRMASQAVIDIAGMGEAAIGDADQLAFRLKTTFTELRAAFPAIGLGLVATAGQRSELRRRNLAPYLDFFAEPVPHGGRPGWPRTGEPYALASAAGAGEQNRSPGDPARWLWQAPADVTQAGALAGDLARAMPLLVADLVPGGAVDVSCGSRPVPAFLNPRTLDTIALVTGCASDGIALRPTVAGVERVALSHGDVLVRVPAAEGLFADNVRVVGARELTVQEIVARHQAAAARQRALVRTLISTGSMTLTFEAPGFPAPVVISSEAVIYEGLGRTEIEQRSIRVNGIEFKRGGVPRLPIIEPERVASPPLAIALTDVYRYTLAGRDRIGGTQCYVVEFTPAANARALFRGRAWIAADSFAMVRVAATQTGLRGPIVSSEQIDDFAPRPAGVWLLARSEVRQIYEGAGHRTPIHRVLAIAAHEINPPDLRARRAAAHQTASVMLRDTPEGFRYLRLDRAAADRPPEGGGSAAKPGSEPAVSGAAQRVRTIAFGAIVDPNISRPLPFAGLSYVDFNLFNTGTQVNAFFGGTYGQLAFSVPSVRGTRWQLAGRAFGIATSYNDRSFREGREIYEHNIRQRPAHASASVLRPMGTRLTARAGYELDYTQFRASDLTSSAFRVPADQVAHTLRVALEGQYAGWHGSLWWAPARRSGWRPWGSSPNDYAPRHAGYQRYGINVTRPIVLGPALVARIEAAWMDGHDLDRFSRYAFGTFDNRLRGYPSALIRYDRGGVIRTAFAWAVSRRLRVDGFADSAYVHDPGFGPGLRRYTGVGAGVEGPAPFGVLTSVEWGYGLQGVNASGRRGTHVVRINAFKIF